MSSTSGKVEDLVKKALKEAMDKRKMGGSEPDPDSYTIPADSYIEKLFSEPVVAAPSKKPKISTKQQYLSSVIDREIDDYDDFGVTVFDDYVWDERIASFVPIVDYEYILDVDLASDVLRAWELGEKVLCYGPTGAGKSSMIEQLCARTNRPFIRVNCSGDMDSSMMFGQLTAKDGSTVWVDGTVTEAVRYGAVFAWDEWDLTPPEISMGLQWLLEDKGKLFLKEMPGSTNDKMVIPHEHFRLVATGNTQGQGDDTGAHAGTNVQNSATLDRFGTCVHVSYLPPAIEERMLRNKYSMTITDKAAKELVKLANLVRQGYEAGQFNLTMSPRTLFSMCRKMQANCSLKKAFEVVYLNKLNDTQKKVAKELFTKIYGASA